MASPLKLSAKDKAALWRANKEKIRHLVSRGLELNQIEEELHRDGCHITAQLREFIMWEKRFPEVKVLLEQGLDVATVEERMRLNGWIWTDNIKRKALWEFHRDEIIALYKSLRSVEAVQEIMTRKGFPPQTRIYYEWLHDWGVSTGINRNLSEADAWSHGSPGGSNRSATPGSTTSLFHQKYELAPIETAHSPHSDMVGNGNRNLQQEGHVDVYRRRGGLMDVDEEYKFSTVQDPSYLGMGTASSGDSSGYSNEPQFGTQGGHQNPHNTPQKSSQGSSHHDDNDGDQSDECEETHDPHNASRQYDANAPPSSGTIVVPVWVYPHVGSASQDMLGQSIGLPGKVIHQNSPMTSGQMVGASLAYRDSGYVSKTNSVQSAGVESLRPSRPASYLRNASSQESTGRKWAPQNTALHSISCPENHQGMVFNFRCCGSSSLQELALVAMTISPQLVYECLCSYMKREGMRLWDLAGNTFLHKLAVTGAPWEYFQAGFKANIDPCHPNAYGQTFVHVLNVSAFQDNLTECLSFLRECGIDFGRRDASGRTPLHCLLDQPISPQTAREILKLIDVPGRQLSLRDVFGRTPYEIFEHTFPQQASTNPRWSNPELQQQVISMFKDAADGGVLRLSDEGVDWQKITENPDDLRVALQSQYKEVIDNAKNGIAVEAADGSNAFHAQAALTTTHDAATDLCTLEKFISDGIDTNGYDKLGRTPLEAIITQPRDYETELTTSEKVCLLIDKGKASIHSRNRLGHTPLFSAAIRGLDRTTEALLQRGSHVNIRANDGQSLLGAVIEADSCAFVEYCLASYTSQYHEAQCSRIEACKVLLERYGAVSDPIPAQAMGYPVFRRPSLQ